MIPTEFRFCGRQVFLERGPNHDEDAHIVWAFINFIRAHPACEHMVLDPEWAVRQKKAAESMETSP